MVESLPLNGPENGLARGAAGLTAIAEPIVAAYLIGPAQMRGIGMPAQYLMQVVIDLNEGVSALGIGQED